MCQLTTKVVYGIPLPAISLLYAAAALEEIWDAMETLKEERGRSRIPPELVELVEHHLVAGRAETFKTRWEERLSNAPHACVDPCEWCRFLRIDDVIEASASSEDIRIQRLRHFLARPEFNFELASQTPIRTSISALENEEGLNWNNAICEERLGEPVWIACVTVGTSETKILSEEETANGQVDQTDLSDCLIDELEGPVAFLETTRPNETFEIANGEEFRLRLENFLKICDLALNSHSFTFFDCEKLLKCWKVVEIKCRCRLD